MSTSITDPTEDELMKREIELKKQGEQAEVQIHKQSKRIEYYLTDYSVELLAMKMNKGQFVIPAYQREDTWEPERKSRFIESLLMGLPIPFLLFWERENGKLEVVDGSQRLRTIEQFLGSELVIGELTELTELTGLRFCHLPESRQLKIKNRSIRGIILNEHADEQARFDIFERVNTSSKLANKAEVRRGALVGPFLDLVIKLSKDQLFMKLAPLPDKSVSLRKREEMVTRFFGYSKLYLKDFDGYHDRPGKYLFSYAKTMNALLEEGKIGTTALEQQFNRTMSFVEATFPNGFKKSGASTQTYYTRFESIAIGSFLAIRDKPEICEAPPDVVSWIEGEDFKEYSKSGGANAKSRMKARFEFVRDKLLGS